MRVVRPEGIGQPVYVLPETGRKPLAGPFEGAFAARLWIIEKVEAGLSEAKRAIWRDVSARLPAPTDLGLELGLIGFVAHGRSLEQIAKYIPRRPVERIDRKLLAAGVS